MRALSRSLGAAILAAVLAGGAVQPAQAQNSQNGRQTDWQRANVSFGGGSVESYITTLAKQYDDINVIIQPAARDIHLGAVELKSATFYDAVMAVEVLVDDPRAKGLSANTGGPTIFPTSVFRIGLETVATQREWMPETKVWALAPILESGMSPEAVLSAIETALDLSGGEAVVRFHAETQLLMVFGSPPQLDAVEQVINQLEGTVSWRENRDKPQAGDVSREQVDALRIRVSDLVEQISRLREENADLRQQLSER